MQIPGFARRALELVSRNRVLRRSIRVNGKSATIFVSPDSQLRYFLPGRFHRDLIAIAAHFVDDGDRVWDLGANIGVFTFAAALANPTGTIVALEPDTWLAGLMLRTRATTTFASHDIRIVPAAVSDTNGVSRLMIARRGRSSNALVHAVGSNQMGGSRHEVFVPSLTADTVAASLGRPDFVKLDVEGAESLFLSGATAVLRDAQPTIYAEVYDRNLDDVTQRLQGLGYRIFDTRGREGTAGRQSNYFAVHKENEVMLARLARYTPVDSR